MSIDDHGVKGIMPPLYGIIGAREVIESSAVDVPELDVIHRFSITSSIPSSNPGRIQVMEPLVSTILIIKSFEIFKLYRDVYHKNKILRINFSHKVS